MGQGMLSPGVEHIRYTGVEMSGHMYKYCTLLASYYLIGFITFK